MMSGHTHSYERAGVKRRVWFRTRGDSVAVYITSNTDFRVHLDGDTTGTPDATWTNGVRLTPTALPGEKDERVTDVRGVADGGG